MEQLRLKSLDPEAPELTEAEQEAFYLQNRSFQKTLGRHSYDNRTSA